MKDMIVRWKGLPTFDKVTAVIGAVIAIPLFICASPILLIGWGLINFRHVVWGD